MFWFQRNRVILTTKYLTSLISFFVLQYDTTEQQLREVFSQAGNVVKMEMKYDRITGRPKGFAFCEFQDADQAQCSIRTLNGYDMGGRPLKVGFADAEQAGPFPVACAAAAVSGVAAVSMCVSFRLRGNVYLREVKIMM